MGRRKHPKRDEHCRDLRKHILACGDLKVFAFDHGISISHANRLSIQIGFRPMRISESERARILDARKEAA